MGEDEETIEVPVEGDETIIPEEEVSEEVVEDIVEESKKVKKETQIARAICIPSIY